jgi:L-ascorbate metabolism protein UlaG (beta-lactamase superfamily)
VADRLKIDAGVAIGLDDGTSVEISGIRFCGVASAHEGLERDEHGRAKYLGYVLQFGGWTLYHSGDTVRYEGMAEKLRPFRIDVALLPINGRAPERRGFTCVQDAADTADRETTDRWVSGRLSRRKAFVSFVLPRQMRKRRTRPS